MYGNDWNYAKTRLEGTWVRLKGEPVFIHLIDSCDNCQVAPMTKAGEYGTEKSVKLDDLDLCPFSLGYCNFNGVALYVSRQPMRRDWKQGLRLENIIVLHNGEPTQRFRLRSRYSYNMFMGIYPTYEEALESSKSLGSYAWHKHWAVDTAQVLRYKYGEIVGSIVDGKPVLDKGYEYLKESLQESL